MNETRAPWRGIAATMTLSLTLALPLRNAALAMPPPKPDPAAQAPMAPANAASSIVVPPLNYRDRTLANGLRVLSLQDRASPTVSIQVWVRVGSKDDPAGRSGFAHLFEHIMFKSTRYLAAEQFDRLTEDVGGMNNASTNDDYTEYHEVVPSNHLERLLWAEAERLSNLNVDQAVFASERAVVQEEFRQRVLASPYGRLFYLLSQYGWQVHPYRRPGIGSIEDLDAATVEDVRRFHATYYRPDNAVLIVAGDLDDAQLDAWVDTYFGPLVRPPAPVPRVVVQEPRWTQDRRFEVRAPGVPLPAVALLWLAPEATHPDVPALRVAEALLASGESSRLNQALVYRSRLASQAMFSFDRRADSGLLMAAAIAADGRSVADNTRALREQIALLARGPISAVEMAKVRTRLITQALLDRETALGRGQALGQATMIDGDPAAVNRELAALAAVTAADVQRVVRTWLLQARSTMVTYRNGPANDGLNKTTAKAPAQ